MKKIYILLFALLLWSANLFGQVSLTYKISLYDSFGDGWNGASLDVQINGTFVQNITLPFEDRWGPVNYYFSVSPGDIITTRFNPGIFDGECYYNIYNEAGTTVAVASGSSYAYPHVSYTVPGSNSFYENDPGLCSAVVDYEVPRPVGATVLGQIDASGLTDGSTFPVGSTLQQYLIELGGVVGGVPDIVSFYVNVQDVELPVAVCKDVTLFLDETGHVTLAPEDVDGGSGDNCGLSSLSVNLTDFDCGYLGYNTVLLTAEDNSGNTASCIAEVTVADILPPQITSVADVEVAVAAGVCETAIDYPHPYVYDNCEITLELLSGLGENGIFPVGTTTETWVAIDKWDNSDTLSFNVTVTAPNTAPTIGTIADVTVDEDSSPVTIELTGISWGTDCNAQEVTVTAESSNTGLVSVTVSYTEGETGSLELAITPEMTGEAEITVTVTDSEGATATATFKVMVTAVNHAPVLVTPIADQTVNASYVLKVPVPAGMFADADGDELQVKVLMQEPDTLPEWAVFASDTIYFTPMIADTGCYHMVVKASDPDGAFATDTFQLCVEGYPVSAGEIAAGGFGVNMYPNPTRGEVTIGISSGFHNVQLTVSDIAGRAVLRKQYTMVERITFDMSDKVSGMYLVTLDIDGERIMKKLVVDRK